MSARRGLAAFTVVCALALSAAPRSARAAPRQPPPPPAPRPAAVAAVPRQPPVTLADVNPRAGAEERPRPPRIGPDIAEAVTAPDPAPAPAPETVAALPVPSVPAPPPPPSTTAPPPLRATPADPPPPVVDPEPEPSVASPPEQPRRTTGSSGAEQKGADALSLISYPWPQLGYEIVFLPPQAGIRGRTFKQGRRIEIYVRPSDSARQVAFDVGHEIAHAFDFTMGTSAGRARWQQARGIAPDRAWFGCNGCGDLATPAGDFAESFAAWQVPGGDFRSRLGPVPDDAQVALLIELTQRPHPR